MKNLFPPRLSVIMHQTSQVKYKTSRGDLLGYPHSSHTFPNFFHPHPIPPPTAIPTARSHPCKANHPSHHPPLTAPVSCRCASLLRANSMHRAAQHKDSIRICKVVGYEYVPCVILALGDRWPLMG